MAGFLRLYAIIFIITYATKNTDFAVVFVKYFSNEMCNIFILLYFGGETAKKEIKEKHLKAIWHFRKSLNFI